MQQMDLHIDISAIIDYYNSRVLDKQPLPFLNTHIYTCLQEAFLAAGYRPFLQRPLLGKDSDNAFSYYQKYQNALQNWTYETIPDFFEKDGDFYDLSRSCFVRREDVGDESFTVLFLIKFLEIIDFSENDVAAFLDFQLYDNFFGDQSEYIFFLRELPAIAKDCRQLPAIVRNIDIFFSKDPYIKFEGVADNGSSIENERQFKKLKRWNEFINSRKGFSIPHTWSIDDVKQFFSFLYDRRASFNEALLTKEQFETIFKDGLVIPSQNIQTKFKLNTSSRSPLKLLDAAIYRFWYIHKSGNWFKMDLVLFFASFLVDYERVLFSKKELDSVSSNITSKLNKYSERLDKYMPKCYF